MPECQCHSKPYQIIKVHYLETYDLDNWKQLAFSKPGDACFDLRTVEDKTIYPHKPTIVKTGVRTAFNEEYVLHIYPRSGLACKKGLTVANSPGTVDSGYRGEIMIGLVNNTNEPIVILRGERIAQARLCNIVPTSFITDPYLDETERGEGGFGSTGST